VTIATQEPGPNADRRFVEHYTRNSVGERTRQRFQSVQRMVMALRRSIGAPAAALDVVDVGCGAGTQTLMWSREGHRATGIDISAPLIEVARARAAEVGQTTQFMVGSATSLPLPDASVDVVLVSELLEHLIEWEPCVDEATRILRPGGVIYLSTTSRLCPVQQEFTLPGYSWYPRRLQKHCERLSVTTHPQWVQHTTYPAVHWFTFYQLRDYLAARGVSAVDRFDTMDAGGSALRGAALGAIRSVAPLRFMAHVMTPYTMVLGHKRA
jgi:ubiquinone/menaquinone biosynthesis C-methylase UbiE